jgi:hypothetical protein
MPPSHPSQAVLVATILAVGVHAALSDPRHGLLHLHVERSPGPVSPSSVSQAASGVTGAAR